MKIESQHGKFIKARNKRGREKEKCYTQREPRQLELASSSNGSKLVSFQCFDSPVALGYRMFVLVPRRGKVE